MSRCRSSAPAIALPTSLIEVLETVDARCMLFHSVSVDFNVKVLVHADEPNEPVPAENGHDCHVSGTLQPLLEILINAGGVRGVRALSGVAMEVCQQAVTELFQLDQQIV